MSELKNLLVLKSQLPVSQEMAEVVNEILQPLLHETNSELIFTGPEEDVTFHPSALIVSRLDRLCDAIERQCEVNQAVLAYLVGLDGGEVPHMDSSLDG